MAAEIEMPLSVAFAPHITTNMNALQYGAYASLIHEFWMHQAEIPEEQAELARLARCHPRRWAEVKGKVMSALNSALPGAVTVYGQKLKVKKTMRENGHKNVANIRRVSRIEVEPLSETNLLTLPIQPAKQERYKGDGRTDLAQRAAAVNRERRGVKAGLREKAGGAKRK